MAYKKVYGAELADQIKRKIEHIHEVREERYQRMRDGDTDYDDCFMSIRTEAQSLHECEMQLEILKGDGTMEIEAIFDEEGNEIRVNSFLNKWGGTSYVGRGIFASSMNALLKKTGWQKRTIKVPVWTKFCAGSGGGMCAVYTGSYECVRWHTNMVTGEYVGYPE